MYFGHSLHRMGQSLPANRRRSDSASTRWEEGPRRASRAIYWGMRRSLRLRARPLAALFAASVLASACHPLYVVVPQPRDQYSESDTLHGRLQGRDVRVTFHYDTTWRTDTVTRWRTIYREGSRTDTVVVIDGRRPEDPPRNGGGGGRRGYQRVDTVVVVVHDTIRVLDPRRPGRGVDTVRVVVHDTVRVGDLRRPGQRVDTVRIVVHDTVRVSDPRRPGGTGTTTGPIVMPPRPDLGRVDTVRIVVHDTVRVVVHDTVRVGTGGGSGEGNGGGGGGDRGRRPRTTFIPPGQYPPSGQCRLWIAGTPPGQQARPAACDALGTIPAGAFILFANKAWDADYDWSTDSSAPPEIAAISRRRFH